jgi:uncharacterized protein YgbK (DUF1537 family)
MKLAADIFPAPFMPLLAAAPALGRYTVFGTHFARYGIGSAGAIHRLDRHPSISKHPVTPMTEADLRLHLARQTKRKIALFDILEFSLSESDARAALKMILAEKPDAVLFDALYPEHLKRIGRLIDAFASPQRPLFSIGSSGIEIALGACWKSTKNIRAPGPTKKQTLTSASANVLIGSGSCSPVTSGQIAWALKRGFGEVALNPARLMTGKSAMSEMARTVDIAVQMLQAGRSVVIHTTRSGANRSVAEKLKDATAELLGITLGFVMREVLERCRVQRVCIAGGDTSSFAARALGIEALEMIAPLTPGAPLCRALAPGSPVDGCEVVFKGGQVGAENYFDILKRGEA